MTSPVVTGNVVTGAVVSSTVEPQTQRSRAKADRRQAMLDAAARLFAAHGFNGVSIEDIGGAAGVSGPAVYRHFSGKQGVLAALLVDASENLFTGGRAVVENAPDGAKALRPLIRFHAEFALSNPDVIRVQDRDLASLADSDLHAVRTLQRRYVELWVRVLGDRQPDEDTAVLRMRAHATFGLLNSTPHSSSQALPRATMQRELERMAWASLSWAHRTR